jgi:hypothetical protein
MESGSASIGQRTCLRLRSLPWRESRVLNIHVTSKRFRPSTSCEPGIRGAFVCQRVVPGDRPPQRLRRRMSVRSPLPERHPDNDERPRERPTCSGLRHRISTVYATPRCGNDSRCGASLFPRGEIVPASTLSPRSSPSSSTRSPSRQKIRARPLRPPEARD